MTATVTNFPRRAKSSGVAFEPAPSAEDRLGLLKAMRERVLKELRETDDLIAAHAPKKPEQRVDPLAYEHEQRRKIAERDWARVHVAGDRNAPLDLPHRPSWKGWWR